MITKKIILSSVDRLHISFEDTKDDNGFIFWANADIEFATKLNPIATEVIPLLNSKMFGFARPQSFYVKGGVGTEVYLAPFDGVLGGSGNTNDKGYFLNSAALILAYPVGQAGWFASVGNDIDNATIWLRDNESSAWVNSGSPTITPGHTIQDEGVSLAQRAKLNFIGNLVKGTDNAGSDSTDVTVSDIATTYTTTRTVYVNSTTGNDTTGDGTITLPWLTIARCFRDKMIQGLSSQYIINITGTAILDDATYGLIQNNYKGNLQFLGNRVIALTGVSATKTDNFTWTTNVDLGVDTYKDKWLGNNGIHSSNGTSSIIAINNVTTIASTNIYDMQDILNITVRKLNYTGGTMTFQYLVISTTVIITTYPQSVQSFIRCKITSTATQFLGQALGGDTTFSGCIGTFSGNVTYRGRTSVGANLFRHPTTVQNTFYGGELFNVTNNIIDGGESTYYSSRTWKISGLGNDSNMYRNQQAVMIVGNDTNLKFFSYDTDTRPNTVVYNVDYFIVCQGYEAGAGLVNFYVSDNKAISGTFDIGLVDHGTYKNFKYIQPDRNNNINIVGTFPEVSGNITTTLLAAASSFINVGSSTENRAIEFTYNITRGTDYRTGKISLLNNGTTVQIIEDSQETNDIGITFTGASIVAGIIQLNYVTTAGTSLSMNYTATRQMVF